MKHFRICLVLLLAALILTGCSERIIDPGQAASSFATEGSGSSLQNSETDPIDTDPQYGYFCSSAFSSLFPHSDALAVIYNEPFRIGQPNSTERWNDGEFDRLLIIPRLTLTYVRAYRVSYDEEGAMSIAETPTYETYTDEHDGVVIAASLDRPEGGAAWYLEIKTPFEKGGMLLEYNGRNGTPQFEFITPDLGREILNSPEAQRIRADSYAAFLRAAEMNRVSPADAAKRYFSELCEIGDGPSFVRIVGGDCENGSCVIRCARFHENYVSSFDDLDEAVRAQYEKYEEIGNELGILGPDFTGELPELYYELTGLTVFNRSLAAKEVLVLVNGEEAGRFTLSDSQICNLIPLSLPQYKADKPLYVELRILSVYYGETADALIDVFPGINGNISNAV